MKNLSDEQVEKLLVNGDSCTWQLESVIAELRALRNLAQAVVKITSIYPGLYWNDEPILKQVLAAWRALDEA